MVGKQVKNIYQLSTKANQAPAERTVAMQKYEEFLIQHLGGTITYQFHIQHDNYILYLLK